MDSMASFSGLGTPNDSSESFVKFDVHLGTFRLEYERPRLKNDGAKPSEETHGQQDRPPT